MRMENKRRCLTGLAMQKQRLQTSRRVRGFYSRTRPSSLPPPKRLKNPPPPELPPPSATLLLLPCATSSSPPIHAGLWNLNVSPSNVFFTLLAKLSKKFPSSSSSSTTGLRRVLVGAEPPDAVSAILPPCTAASAGKSEKSVYLSGSDGVGVTAPSRLLSPSTFPALP